MDHIPMSIDWARVLPVLVSIAIIIAIAILRQYSQTFAAIAATMPINIPLGMWIVFAGTDDKQVALAQFTEAAMLNILPTFAFLVVSWQMTKAGVPALPTIVVGYLVWAVGLALLFLLRAAFSH
jgi:hypothetical protein